jgi:hypothetical protein
MFLTKSNSFLTLPAKSKTFQFLSLTSSNVVDASRQHQQFPICKQRSAQPHFLHFQEDMGDIAVNHDKRSRKDESAALAKKEETSTQTEAHLDFEKVNQILLDYKKHAASWKEMTARLECPQIVTRSNEAQPPTDRDEADKAENVKVDVKMPSSEASENQILSKNEKLDQVNECGEEITKSGNDSAVEASLDLLEAVGNVSKAKELRLKSVRATLLALH